MSNVMKLKGKIVENGYNQESFAEAIGMSKATLIRRMSDGNFTIGEALKIIEVLNLTRNEAIEIFLPTVSQE